MKRTDCVVDSSVAVTLRARTMPATAFDSTSPSTSVKLPPSRVYGVATFYHLFRFEPDRAHSAVVCLGTACYAAGGPELMGTVERHGRAHAGAWTIRAGRCVGSCGLAPVVVCDGETLSRTSASALEQRLLAAEVG